MNSPTPFRGSLDVRGGSPNPLRVLALGASALVALSYLTVLYRVADVVGVSTTFALAVTGATVAGIVCGRVLRTPVALALGAGLLALGMGWYAQSVPDGVRLLVDVGRLTTDIVALLTGLSVLRVVNAGTWAIAFVPAPTFLLWYFVLRRRYVLGALCGGGALGLFVLTSDAGAPLTLVGVVGVAALVGFGELDRRGGSLPQAEGVASVLAAMVVISLLLSVVPGGAADPLLRGGSGGGTIEGNLLNTDEQVSVLGSVSLSPEVRFTVESDAPSYWRVGAYDRYTGGDWYRTGDVRPYRGTLPDPSGDSREITQTYEARTALDVMPAAWRPTEIDGRMADRTQVTPTGALRPAAELPRGTTYTVRSEVPDTTTADLQNAGSQYPDAVAERYTQLPASTPDRVGEFTTRLTANANTPYEKARVIERWLERNKEYSLDVSRPEGDVADAFLFEMDAGYCVYYATTMTAMLRTQGIPARFVVGYTPGERVGENEWVVRGLDSHAWVEVYFPEEGWVRFDPTPSNPRESAEQGSLENAREAGQSNVDTSETSGGGPSASGPSDPGVTDTSASGDATPEPFNAGGARVAGGDPGGDAGAVGEGTSSAGTNDTGAANGSDGLTPSGLGGVAESDGEIASANDSNGSTSSGNSSPELPMPSRERLLLGLVVLGGVVASAHRSGVTGRAYRAVWLRRQRRREPLTDTERAFSRLEYLLSCHHRERRAGETSRTYLTAIGADERARRVGEIYERARYAGAVSDEEATEAISLVDELVAERSRFGLRRLRGRP